MRTAAVKRKIEQRRGKNGAGPPMRNPKALRQHIAERVRIGSSEGIEHQTGRERILIERFMHRLSKRLPLVQS